MATIHFRTKLFKINDWTILLLPKEASLQLPSRGMTAVEGTINDFHFKSTLEPDGRGSHWLKLDKDMLKAIGAHADDTVKLEVESTKEWPEPKVPEDLEKALKSDTHALSLWIDITTMARWDWIRWIQATRQEETRKKRIQVTLSKLNAGKRRPCCFNRNVCTEPHVSQNWVLLEDKNGSRN